MPVSKKLISGNGENYFILKVEWTSMNNFEVNWKKVENGSYVLIKRNDSDKLNKREAFLFIVNGAATLKKYKKDGETIYLLPESTEDYNKPIILSEADDIKMNGKVVDVFNF